MAKELKTKESKANVLAFIEAIVDEQKRDDCYAIAKLMQKVTKEKPTMWGTSIIGFGSYHYKYDSGHEGDSCLIGFSPRKQNITLYIMPGFAEYKGLLASLGKFKTAKVCLYIKQLQDIDLNVLEKLIKSSVDFMKSKYT